MVRLLLVDDHHLVRGGLRALLERDGFTVVGEASSCVEALRDIPKLEPDVILADMSMPDEDGVWLVEQVKRLYTGVPVLMVSMLEEEDHVMRALEAGARGYVSKVATPEEFVTAITEVRRGGTYLQPQIAAKVVAYSARMAADTVLTAREREILALCARSYSNGQIAEHLSITPGTVKTHLHSVYRKLEACDRTKAVEIARKRGLLATD